MRDEPMFQTQRVGILSFKAVDSSVEFIFINSE